MTCGRLLLGGRRSPFGVWQLKMAKGKMVAKKASCTEIPVPSTNKKKSSNFSVESKKLLIKEYEQDLKQKHKCSYTLFQYKL